MSRRSGSPDYDRGTDQLIGLIVMPIVACVTLYALWYVGHAQISAFSLVVFKVVAKGWMLAPFITEGGRPYGEFLQDVLGRVDPSRLSFMQLMQLGNTSFRPLSVPIVIALGFLVYRVGRGGQHGWFNDVMDFEALVQRQNALFPVTTPVLNLDLINTDPDTGPWARKATYISFAVQHRLLETKIGQAITVVKPTMVAYRYKMNEADRVFASQLGPITAEAWPTLMETRPHLAALAAVFGIRLLDKREMADELLNHLAAGFREGDGSTPHVLPTSGRVTRAWKRVVNAPEVLEIINKHGYLHVALYALLMYVQDESGVLAPCSFLWLKPVDRTAWYALHQVRLDVANIEAGGVYSHWLTEREYKTRITKPQVREASKALQLHLMEEGWLAMADGSRYHNTTESSLKVNNEIGTVSSAAAGGGGNTSSSGGGSGGNVLGVQLPPQTNSRRSK